MHFPTAVVKFASVQPQRLRRAAAYGNRWLYKSSVRPRTCHTRFPHTTGPANALLPSLNMSHRCPIRQLRLGATPDRRLLLRYTQSLIGIRLFASEPIPHYAAQAIGQGYELGYKALFP